MGRSNDFRDVIQNTVEPAAFQQENQEEKAATLNAPEFQLKMDPVQKVVEEEEMMPKMNPVQKVEDEEEGEEISALKQNPVQKQGSEEEEEETLEMKKNPVQKKEEEEEQMMPKMVNKKPYQNKAKEVASASTGMASTLPAQLKENMEHSLGGDFSNTQIYENSEKATKMGALAYAQGNEIHFAPGKYDTESKRGKELIGHELTHIVQQKKGVVQNTKKERGMRVNNEFKLEKEADDLGKKAANSSFEDAPRKNELSYEQFINDQPTENNS